MKNIMVLGFVVLFISIIVIGCDRGTPPSPKTAEQPNVSTTLAPEPVKNPIPATSTETAKIEQANTPITKEEPVTVTTSTGLQYIDLVVGTGTEAQDENGVSVHYTGWLTNGTKFDSSVDRGKPFKFKLGKGQVIKGWDEGVKGMKVGGKRKLIIPANLGYADQDMGVIPPNSVLIFEVELLGVQ